VIATVLAVATWMTLMSDRRSTYRRWLYTVHPAVGGIVVAMALLGATHMLGPWSRYVFNDKRQTICDALESNIGENCLTINASARLGAWFFVLQSVLLEAFVDLTLLWN